MSIVGYVNISLELWGCVLSLIVAICLLVGGRPRSVQTRLFLQLLVCNAVILLCDAAAWLFKGRSGAVSWWGVRIANFLVFALGYVLLAIFTHYLTAYLGQRTPVSAAPLRFVRALCAIALLLVVLSQFNHMFYVIDAQNVYHRQQWFWLSQVGGIFGMCVNAGILIRYRRAVEPQEEEALWSYIALPALSMCIQIFVYGVALLNLATTLSILVIFLFLQAEQTRRMKARELELAEMRISIMLSQIQPHFLYNALTSIKGLCVTNPQRAEQAVDSFSVFLRGNMNSLTAHQPIPFSQELTHCKNYLELERLRFGGRVNVFYHLPVTDFSIPTLTLQPIVENAVRHGVTKRREGGTIWIRTGETDTGWKVTVADDGVGFDPQRPDGRSHAGIENVRTRLESQCGGSLSVKSNPGQGTTVELNIPKKGEGYAHDNIGRGRRAHRP
ncbi:histidine kinase [Oscillibacter sp. MSJ-2]|uniref:Histidine kinase n=1 Tax=Dysosmobacter acutus TaxID=2841504 RepID=A0ABS6F616_9FIRM|nr:histidine kinase [Dysosmobacter acutus]MBU5625475.1 histidine kinase [Dysosmobacter acutus]